jgi:neuralized-like protein 4
MTSFHSNHGKRIELSNNGKTASRNINEFNHGIVISKFPLVDDIKFEVRIDTKINSWSGSIEIGVKYFYEIKAHTHFELLTIY